MRVAFAAEGETIGAHFGHCAEYVLADLVGGQVERKTRVSAPPHGACLLPPFLREHGVECVVVGGMGPRAERLCEELGIRVVQGAEGPLAEAVRAFLDGSLVSRASACDCGGEACGSHPCHCSP